MKGESRIQKSLLNARVNLIFTLISVFIAFFSRQIFINCLGVEFVGLTSTLQSLLSFLNLSELGVGAAIIITLYKPISNSDQQEIKNIISVLAFLYSLIGSFILVGGIILSLFLPLIFETECPTAIIYLAYYAFLSSSLITYFINYKQTLLTADQKNYVVIKYLRSANIAKLLLQMTMAHYYANLYIWVAIEFTFGIIAAVILNIKIRQTYPWLQTHISDGKKLIKNYKSIIILVRQIFLQKISYFSLTQFIPILINGFVSISMVTYYTNYLTITEKLTAIINALLVSTYASVGNLIAEGDKQKIAGVYEEMTAIRTLIGGALVFLIYHLVEPFISLWLGPQFILSRTTLILILIIEFINQYRSVLEQFLAGYGLFKDVWASFAEVGIFLLVALICGKIWGLNGILLGSIISRVLIQLLWKPYFLFHEGMHRAVREYWYLWGKNIFSIIICWACCLLIFQLLPNIVLDNFLSWTGYASMISIIYLLVANILMYFIVPGHKKLIQRLVFLVKNGKK